MTEPIKVDAAQEAPSESGANLEPVKPDSAKARVRIERVKMGRLKTLLRLPGLAAVSLYMMMLAGINILGVAAGQTPRAFLIFSALFFAAGCGLLLALRWAWALTLTAVVLLAGLFFWKFAASHDFPYVIQGLLNMVFFLYLVRTEVRERLR